MVLYIDIETYSTVNIKHGIDRYATGAEIMLVQCAIDDGPVDVQDLTIEGAELHPKYIELLRDPTVPKVAHNAWFESTVFGALMPDLEIPPESWHCTMAQAYAHGLAGSLESLCSILGVPTDKAKDRVGKQLIQLFCKPLPAGRKLRRATKETHPIEWAKFKEYARLDVEAARAVHRKLPVWNYRDAEKESWLLDQKMNRRGIPIDLEFAQAAIDLADDEQRRLATRAAEVTNGELASTRQRDSLLMYLLLEHGVELPDMQASTLERRLNDESLPAAVRELVRNRLAASTTSVSKYRTLINATGLDGRLRGAIQWCGAARTGRWAGRIFQPQNLKRPTLTPHDILLGIAAVLEQVADILYDDVMELLSSAMRSVIAAKPGHKIVAADLSNIEGRVLAWLAGERWKIDAFRAYDNKEGPDLYVAAYARAFGTLPEAVSKNERQIGKVMELALGYQGGVGAFLTFADLYRIELDPLAEHTYQVADQRLLDQAASFYEWVTDQKGFTNYGLSESTYIAMDTLKRAWREAHPWIVNFWNELEMAVRVAIQNPRTLMQVGRLRIRRDGAWLRIGLPSGRCLCYPSPRVGDDDQISYMGVNQYTRKWARIPTYGGKLCLAAGVLVLTREGWIPIENVPTGVFVWDGIEWVRTGGPVFNGVRKTMRAFGARMTPDHEILTKEGWRSASQSAGLDRAACRLPDGVEIPRVGRPKVAVGCALRVPQEKDHGRIRVSETKETRRTSIVRVQTKPDVGGREENARHVGAPSVRGVAVDDRPVSVANTPVVEKLRRSGHSCLRALATVVRKFLARHGANLPSWIGLGSREQRRPLHPKELSVGKPQNKLDEQEKHRTQGGCSRAIEAPQDSRKHTLLPTGPRLALVGTDSSSVAIEPVFDLLNCGPRHRFVIWAGGSPLIVHNCENVTQAVARDILSHNLQRVEDSGYRPFMTVHDEVVSEPPDHPDYNAKHLAQLVAANPPWADGLPLAAAGFEGPRYLKD